MALWCVPARGQQLILPVAGVITIDASPGKAPYEVFVNAVITSVVFTNQTPGQIITVLFLQDSTGHGVTFGGNILNACTVTATANALTSCQFQYDARTVQWTGLGGSGGGITSVSSLPATCTAGTSQPIQLTGSITVGTPSITFGAGTVFYCDSTNHYSPVSQGSGASPVMGFYLSSQCPPANNALCFNTFADTQQANDVTYTSGSKNVSAATAHWVAGDIGKRFFGYGTCSAFHNIATNANVPYTTSAAVTIVTVTDSQHIVTDTNAANSSGANTGCAIWGHPDDAGAALMDTAAQSAPQCPRLHFPNGYYMFANPHFFTQPTACANLGSSFPFTTTAANMFYAAGYELDGRGSGTTVWYVTPGFPESGPTGCQHGLSGNACWVVVDEGRWSNLLITGGGNYNAPGLTSSSHFIEVNGPASLDNFTCVNFASQAGGNNAGYGIAAYLWTQLYQVNNSACGDRAIATNVSSSVTAIKVSIDNPNEHGWSLGVLPDYYTQAVGQFSKYNLICYDCLIWTGNGLKGSAYALISNAGAQSVKFYNLRFGIFFTPTLNGIVGYQCSTAANCKADFQDSFMDMSGGGTNTATGLIGIQCTQTCTNKLENTVLKGTTGGSAYTDVAGSVLNDMGGNTFGTFSLSGSVLKENNSANEIPVTAAKTVLSAGWGSTAAVTALSGGDFPIGFTVTNSGTGQGASPTITYTFPTPLPVSPISCSALQVGGTNATGTFTSSGLSATGATFTFSLTPTASSTEIVQVTCVTP